MFLIPVVEKSRKMTLSASDTHLSTRDPYTLFVAVVYTSLASAGSFMAILLSPLKWIGVVILTISNTIRFCLTAPFHHYLEPLEGQSKHARSYEEWRNFQILLDDERDIRSWAVRDEDPSYDWNGLQKFKEDFELCRRSEDVPALRGNLRAQASRNCCSLLATRLYSRSQIQTKRLIHEYIHEVRRCIERLSRRESITRSDPSQIDEEKRRLFGDIRQILGRTTLVLQGGAMLSLCHLGVVKALHRRRLLPKIITATGTGALVAALVGCTSDADLLSTLQGSSIDVSAFAQAREQRAHADAKSSSFPLVSWIRALTRRTKRFLNSGHFFDIDVLAQCVRDNVGDLTFEEAYAKSGRILNITIAKPDVEGTPQLLNYITAPHVLVWSAAAASVATSKSMFAVAPLKCKNDIGVIDRYFAVDSPAASNTRRHMQHLRIPMERIGELFDVNHYIVSQTRPYLVPFMHFRDFMSRDPILGALTKMVYCEFIHRLGTLHRLGLVPTFIQRIYIDEQIPSTSSWSKFVVTPELSFSDYFKALNFPSPKVIDEWSMKGERSVWPKMCQIKVRCCIEFEIDAASQKDYGRFGTRTERSRPATVNGHDE